MITLQTSVPLHNRGLHRALHVCISTDKSASDKMGLLPLFRKISDESDAAQAHLRPSSRGSLLIVYLEEILWK